MPSSPPIAIASSTIPGQRYLIDTASFTDITTIAVGNNPVHVAISPDGQLVFVNNFGGGTSVIDRVSNQVIGTIPTDAGSRGITFVH